MGLKNFLGLSFSLAKANFKLKNEESYLGILWYLLGPILMFILLLTIFSGRLGKGVEDYPLYLLLGLIMFNFFQNTTKEATGAIISNGGLIKSLKFSHKALINSNILKSLLSHFFEIIIFIIFLLFFKISIGNLIFYPLILFFLYFFTYGVSLFLSSLTVYFVDMQNIWNFVSRLIWFATPIFYAIEGQTRLYYLNLLNPMYYFITITREIVIYSKIPEIWMILGMMIYTLLALIIGIIVFDKLKYRFAELR